MIHAPSSDSSFHSINHLQLGYIFPFLTMPGKIRKRSPLKAPGISNKPHTTTTN